MEKHCIYRLVTCRYCEQKIVFCNNQSHEENCECLPLCCVNQCGMKILRKKMSSHITDSCANTIIPCQYLNIGCKFKGMRKEHETHANSSMQNHLSMAISKLDAIENKITLTVDTLENKIVSKLNALENKMASKMESLETKVASESIALENKITSKMESLETKISSESVALDKKITLKVESFNNKNASKVDALENKITSTVDVLKNELISKVDAQKHEIMLHERNLEVIKAFLALEMVRFKDFFPVFEAQDPDSNHSVFHNTLYRLVRQETQELHEFQKTQNPYHPRITRPFKYYRKWRDTYKDTDREDFRLLCLKAKKNYR
nr:TNF receptor-associated factor 5-like isoform X1 [Hydra vulgaris]